MSTSHNAIQWTFHAERPTRQQFGGKIDVSLTGDLLLGPVDRRVPRSAVKTLEEVRIDPGPLRRGFLDFVLFVAESPSLGAVHVPPRAVEFLPDGRLDAGPLLADRTFVADWAAAVSTIGRLVLELVDANIRSAMLAALPGPWWPPSADPRPVPLPANISPPVFPNPRRGFGPVVRGF